MSKICWLCQLSEVTSKPCILISQGARNLTSVFPIPLIVLQEMRYNSSWNHVANILSLIRSVNLKEMSRENIKLKEIYQDYHSVRKPISL